MENTPNRDVSAKGYYYNLGKSPYVWKSPYGDIYRLPSAKRLEMMETKTTEEIQRVNKLLRRNNLENVLPDEIVNLIKRYCVEAVYRQIVG